MKLPFPEDAQSAKKFIKIYNSYGSSSKMSKDVDKSAGHLRRLKRKAEEILENHIDEIIPPDIPSDKIDTQTLVDRICESYKRKEKKQKALDWMEFTVNTDKPIGLVFVGDPHIDNPGTDWPQLRHDAKVCDQDGIHAINMGDLRDNWPGRMKGLYEKHEVSGDQSWQLVEWFYAQSGFRWLVSIMGNHDLWQNRKLLKECAKHYCPVTDWRARFQLVFKNGFKFAVDAAHDHKGHSQYNTVHGNKKTALWDGQQADLYVSGHKHNYGYADEYANGRKMSFLRVAGYKRIDDYARTLGHEPEWQDPASVMIIIDPKTGQTWKHENLKQGAEFLKHLRDRT